MSFTCEDEDENINDDNATGDGEEEAPAVQVLPATPLKQGNRHKPHVSYFPVDDVLN